MDEGFKETGEVLSVRPIVTEGLGELGTGQHALGEKILLGHLRMKKANCNL